MDCSSHDHCYSRHARGRKVSSGFSSSSPHARSNARTRRRPLPMSSRQMPAVFCRCSSLGKENISTTKIINFHSNFFVDVIEKLRCAHISISFCPYAHCPRCPRSISLSYPLMPCGGSAVTLAHSESDKRKIDGEKLEFCDIPTIQKVKLCLKNTSESGKKVQNCLFDKSFEVIKVLSIMVVRA